MDEQHIIDTIAANFGISIAIHLSQGEYWHMITNAKTGKMVVYSKLYVYREECVNIAIVIALREVKDANKIMPSKFYPDVE